MPNDPRIVLPVADVALALYEAADVLDRYPGVISPGDALRTLASHVASLPLSPQPGDSSRDET